MIQKRNVSGFEVTMSSLQLGSCSGSVNIAPVFLWPSRVHTALWIRGLHSIGTSSPVGVCIKSRVSWPVRFMDFPRPAFSSNTWSYCFFNWEYTRQDAEDSKNSKPVKWPLLNT